MKPIYLDHNATTALDPAVREEMMPWLGGKSGNPSSIHSFGQESRRAIDKARARAARFIGAQPEELVFTGGGTEANNLAVLGAVAASGRHAPRLVTTLVEHQSVMNPCRQVGKTGGTVAWLPVDGNGLVRPGEAVSLLAGDTLLLSVMLANNDIGTIQPVGELSGPAGGRGVLLHTDAVQAAGKIALDVRKLGVDLLSFSGHKLYGPQGVGALYVRKGTRLSPLAFGGRQERALRPGTENVAGIVGFGKACELAGERLAADAARMEVLRSSFESAVLERVPGATVNGLGAPRLANTSNVSFDGVDGEALVINLDLAGLAASTGAACSSADREPSHVLTAMGRSPAAARSSVRFSFGRDNGAGDLATAIDLVVRAVRLVRESHR